MWRYQVGSTELYAARARLWSPDLGTFLSIDEFAFRDSRGTLWGWPGQNPIHFGDPTGRSGWPPNGFDQALIGLEDGGYLRWEQNYLLGFVSAFPVIGPYNGADLAQEIGRHIIGNAAAACTSSLPYNLGHLGGTLVSAGAGLGEALGGGGGSPPANFGVLRVVNGELSEVASATREAGGMSHADLGRLAWGLTCAGFSGPAIAADLDDSDHELASS